MVMTIQQFREYSRVQREYLSLVGAQVWSTQRDDEFRAVGEEIEKYPIGISRRGIGVVLLNEKDLGVARA
jgi:hypothetical protein